MEITQQKIKFLLETVPVSGFNSRIFYYQSFVMRWKNGRSINFNREREVNKN
jgi:hypothetical protein